MPLSRCRIALRRSRAAFADDKLFAAFNVGLGESAGELAFERNEFTPSSSFLQRNRSSHRCLSLYREHDDRKWSG